MMCRLVSNNVHVAASTTPRCTCTICL